VKKYDALGQLIETCADHDGHNLGLWRVAIVIRDRRDGHHLDVLLWNGRVTVVHISNTWFDNEL